ncbi:hypothetical protein DL96DRAFT_1816507 [Flagelloscypha sp. PMI_526]|nr:hypothetical protein DL96DRAFT_1816507 [Flagelloscypha sp. PMI_526]
MESQSQEAAGLDSGLDPLVARALSLSSDILRYYQLSDLVVILGYGIYLPLFLKSIFLVKSRLRTSVPSRWLFALLMILFVSTTIHLVSGLSVNFTILDWPNWGELDDPIQVKLKVAAEIAQTATEAFFYSGRINIALIDAIVVWRAYVLQSGNRPVRILLVFLLVATIIYSAIMMVLTPDPERFKLSEQMCNALNIVRDGLALALNIVATVCIAWAAWTFSHFVKSANSARNRSTPFVSRVFQLMLEGGVILALIQIVTIILGLFTTNSESDSKTLTSAGSIGFMIISEILISASAIYPSLITILVAEERSTMISDTTAATSELPSVSYKARPPSLAISVSSTTYVHSDSDKAEKGIAAPSAF